MRRIHYINGSYKDVEDNHSWEYENDPDWKETEDLEITNKCSDGIRQPVGGCFGCGEGSLCE